MIGLTCAGLFPFASVVHAACTNPSPLPSSFASPCPVFSLSASSVSQAQTLTLSATPQIGTDYILTTAYISNGTNWNPYTLAGNNAVPNYSSAQASLTLSSGQLTALSLGTHYAVVWDWLWDATAQCYKGPGLDQCNTGQWRVQSFSVTTPATPTPTPTPTPSPNSLARDCTLYASASGSDTNSGLTPSLPKSLTGASAATVPGSVVCIKAGTYNFVHSWGIPHSGTVGNYITYEAYGDGPANIVYTGISDQEQLVSMDSAGPFPNGGFHYLKFIGLNIDGGNHATNGLYARYSHHIEFRNNYTKGSTSAGIACGTCDYITVDHNVIYLNGENMAQASDAASGIGLNILCSFDSYSGFHDVVSNNIVSGTEDILANTDGNGIIMDTNCSGAMGVLADNNPPELVINNVVYMNSGECIANYTVSRIWTVNNSCYKNSLNTNSGFVTSHGAEFGDNTSELDYYVNNIAYAWKATSPPAFSEHNAVQATYFSNMYVGGLDFTPNAPSQFFNQDPKYANPPVVGATADFQWRTAPDPATIGTALQLQAGSPAIGKGIDPSTLPGVPANIVSDLKMFVYTDINGNVRKAGSWDLGAYEH